MVRLASHDVYLGRFGSPESRRRYGEVIAAWLEGAAPGPKTRGLTVAELIERFDAWAATHYETHHNGGQRAVYRSSLRFLIGHLDIEVSEFGPLELRAARQAMIVEGLCRNEVNRRVGLIRSVFKWGVGRAMCPPSVVEALACVEPLRRGVKGVRESEPVRPVPAEIVERTIEHTSPQVAAMVRLQLLTGMRPGEVCAMRPQDIDRGGEVWWYRPERHKNAHRGKGRCVPLVSEAQAILSPFLLRPADRHCFSPAEAMKWHAERRHERRSTPLSCGNAPGDNVKRRPRRAPGERYSTGAYAIAIRHATRRAFPAPPGVAAEEARRWHAEHAWAPNRIRHLVATEIRRRFGLDAARVVLGHSSSAVTASVYAELQAEQAAETLGKFLAAERVG